MAYNKSKFVEAAQKLLNQGKVPQAISEYQQILKFEPRDQVTLMTVGELYIRQGETFQAIDYFERLAQIFVGDGFLTKAIAVYKRIAKLAPEEIRPLEKLADLYVQQGVMSEARPLFLQLAEIHLKNNRQPEAIGLLKKLLLAEPDNLRIQVRLADLYQAMGQTREAIETYVSAAQRAIARGDHAECEKLADKAIKLEPHNLAALIVKARSASAQGNATAAATILEQVPDLEKGGEQTELLLDLYLKNARWEPATALALRVFEADEKNFGPTQKLIEALLESGQGEKAMAILEKSRIPMIDAGEHEVVGRLLNELAARLPGRIEPLEWLVETYGRTSDSFRLPDALAQLGDALVAVKQFDRAKQVLEQLVDREPESDSAKRKLNDLLRKMGLLDGEEVPPPPETHELQLPKAPAPKVRPDLPDSASQPEAKLKAPAEPPLDEDTQKFIAQSLTDVDLFASYGLTQKAIGLLEAILRRAPRHTPTLEKLLDFVLGAGDDRRTAELASHLEQIHQERGDLRSAERFGELRRRFQRAAGLTDADLTPAPAALSDAPQGVASSPADEQTASSPELRAGSEHTAPAEEVVEDFEVISQAPAAAERAEEISASQAPAAQQMHEVDLSDEWASLLDGSADAQGPASADAPAHHESAEKSAAELANDALAAPEIFSSVPAPATPSETPAEFAAASEPSAPGVEEFSIDAEETLQPATAESAEASAATPPLDDGEEVAFEIAEPAPAAAAEHNAFAEISAQLPAAMEPEAEVHASPEAEVPLQPEAPAIASETAAPESGEVEEVPVAQAEAEKPESLEDHLAALHRTEAALAEASGHSDAQHSADQPLELELEQDYELVLDAEPLVPAYDQKPPEIPVISLVPEEDSAPEPPAPAEPVPAAADSFAADKFLADLAAEMGELGIGELSPEFAKPAEPSVNGVTHETRHAASDGQSAPLKEVFDEFRAELGEMGSDDEDLETHYNLGVAFREMGLLEEAISEFQKVAQACDRGRPFRYVMQCCTLLGLAFVEKGQPGMAAIWYERALQTPGLGPDNALALRYDLGLAQESAGDHEAALKSFTHVYAMNIDYRDVAERIAALQKPSR
jgi:pilus assembly protein FimV